MSTVKVHKVHLVLPATDYEEAGQLQASAKHWAKHRLPDLLNYHLEKMDREEEVLLIEKVNITLTDYPWNLSDTAWRQILAESLKVPDALTDAFVLITRQWLFYLSNGCLETSTLLSSRQAIEDHLLQNLSRLAPVLVSEAGQGFTAPMWQRLFAQHPAALTVAVLEALLPVTHEQALELYAVLVTSIRERPEATARQLAALAVTNKTVPPSRKAVLLRQLLEPGASTGIHETESLPAEKIPEMEKQLVTDTYIACANAGLVLLFPHLKRFFENTGWVSGDEFNSAAARVNAVQALHWLATGTTDLPAEELLVLPRLLCGMALSDKVDWTDPLPEAVQTEGQALLEAVIGHWKVLQRTSVEGLRQTFLQRSGRLLIRGSSCTLQVEESGVDILLDGIPWGFRHYRLPWMRYTLITEWY